MKINLSGGNSLCRALAVIVALCVEPVLGAELPSWVRQARLAGLSLQSTFATSADIAQRVTQLKNQNVSVVELDTSLSRYLSDTEFQMEVGFIDTVAKAFHAEGIKVVIYYPAMEVVTPNGETSPRSMAKDHPDWIQIGLSGKANVFYGSQEDWVQPGMESAWMSPNSPYREYFINRVRTLATQTEVDGLWMDVPIYLDTGAPWADVGPYGAEAFRQWSRSKGFNNGAGYEPPVAADFNAEGFRVWLRWRHENLAAFIEEVRVKALEVNPNFILSVETYPMDYMDTVWTGLDPAFMTSRGNFLRVWEVDSVSNLKAMQWSSIEDFSNKIAMYKWARGLDRDLPSWSFVYGNEPLDTGLVMAAAVATQNAPFETKTPIMTQTVGSAFRTQWFDFIKQNQGALLETERLARIGIWFSSPTREYQDMPAGAQYGMYLESVPPSPDPHWWAVVPNSTLRKAPHLGGWRGAAHGMHQLGIPYKVISDPGSPGSELQDVSLVWLPSVGALSDASAVHLRHFVQQGGTLLATGHLPGVMDEYGKRRPRSVLDELFGLGGALSSGPRMQEVGSGVAIYRPDLRGLDLFAGEGGNAALAQRTLGELERLLRIHAPDDLIVNLPAGVFIEISKPTANQQHLYIVNYTGCLQPLVSRPIDLPFEYRAPQGFRVVRAEVKTPDLSGASGVLPVAPSGKGLYAGTVRVDQFALVTFHLEMNPATPNGGLSIPVFSTLERQQAVESGLRFLRNAMRDTAAPVPYRYGIRTNRLDNAGPTDVYTGGHHVTAEHMGLYLRVAALLRNEEAYREGLVFVRDVLFSRGYHVVGWSMHKDKRKRFLQSDNLDGQPVQFAANAPLDDLRTIRGLLEGASLLGIAEAESLGRSVLLGVYWTSVTDRLRGIPPKFPVYPGGLLGYSWDWADQDDPLLSPAAVATGLGRLGTFPIPVDYQDLETISLGAQTDSRWKGVLASAVDLMLAAEIPQRPGLFYNGLGEAGQFTGDFEYPGHRRGNNLKTIQELWTALHLKHASRAAPWVLDARRRDAAALAAQRSLGVFKTFYLTHRRIPEYLTFEGTDVPDCGPSPAGNCLRRGEENLFGGEARIYAQLARLALLFDDRQFAAQVIEEKILTDRVSNPADPRYGVIGVSTAGSDDAEAWNILESLLTLCLEAQPAEDTSQPNGPPVAVNDVLEAGRDRPLTIYPHELLANDSDPDGDILAIQSLSSASAAGGTVSIASGHYIYTPPKGFLGPDSFTYDVTDGRGGTASASVSVTVIQNTGTVPTGIQLDGMLTDWPPSALVISDPDDVTGDANKLDLREIRIHHDPSKVFMAYTNDGPVQLNWAYTLYIDADRVFATGFGFWDIGAEYMVHVTGVYRYTGDGVSWSWAYVGDIFAGQNANILEFSFPRSFIGNPAGMHFIFYGDNAAYPGGTAVDLVPDNATGGATGPKFGSYLFSETTPPPNTAPQAQNVSASTEQDKSVAVTLVASDADADPLTASLTSLPQHGTVVLQGMKVTYTPAAGYTGTDTFRYSVSDGKVSSPEATVSVTVVPKPGGGTAIVIDGNLTDWTAGQIHSDTRDVADTTANLLDMLELRVFHNSTHFYVAYKNAKAVVLNWAYTLYLDTDASNASGFAMWEIGADLALQGTLLYRYAGTGADWKWTVLGEVTSAVSGGVAEMAFLLSQMGNPTPTAIRYMFVGDNSAYAGGSGYDFIPEVVSGGETFLTYVLDGGVAPPPSPTPSIVVDGLLDDWTTVASFPADPADTAGPSNKVDLRQFYFTNDSSHFYLAFQNEYPVELNWGFSLYLDTDSNGATGFRTFALGADYVLQGRWVFRYAGSGTDWKWTFVGDATAFVNGKVVEYSMTRALLGNPQAVRMLFLGDNSAYPGGSGVDSYPDDPNSFVTYTVRP